MKKKTISQLLYKARITKGLTQQEAADLLEINRSYYNLLEKGKRLFPRIKLAKRIANFCGVDTLEIYKKGAE